MSFEVRQFQVEEKKGECIWKFQLGKNSVSQVDFYGEQQSIRSLFHLAQDISHQIQTVADKKKKKLPLKDRVVRKVCEKMIKSLGLSLKSFANDINEKPETVKSYFTKNEMSEQTNQRLEKKCQKWVIQVWVRELLYRIIIFRRLLNLSIHKLHSYFQLSLPPEMFFKSSKKYLDSLFKDGKKISSDFELMNQFYLIVEGDNFEPIETSDHQKTDNMVLIDINLNVTDKYISETFLWNVDQNCPQKINGFIEYFLADILFANEITITKEAMQELIDEARVQLRSQCLYKNLLKKHANVLLNFSTMQLSQDLKEYLIQIELRLLNQQGEIFFEDSFQWDILNELNNVEEFCQILIQDQQIPPKYFSELCFKIKSQINAELEWKFTMLAKTFKSIHRERQSPKLNTQTLTQLKKNIIYSMDVGLPNNPDKSKISPNVYLNNSDLFSTLSRNFDILPEQFQQILQCKQSYKVNQTNVVDKSISKSEAEQELKNKNVKMEDNKYMGNFTNSYRMHNIWRQALESRTDGAK